MKKPFYKTWWFTIIYILCIILTVIIITYNPKYNCKIKGNISNDGEKIYHIPGDQYYNVTKINKTGEKYFCSEKEAEKEGFRRSLR